MFKKSVLILGLLALLSPLGFCAPPVSRNEWSKQTSTSTLKVTAGQSEWAPSLKVGATCAIYTPTVSIDGNDGRVEAISFSGDGSALVKVSSVAINSISPSALRAGAYPQIVVSSFQTGSYPNIFIPAANVNPGELAAGVTVQYAVNASSTNVLNLIATSTITPVSVQISNQLRVGNAVLTKSQLVYANTNYIEVNELPYPGDWFSAQEPSSGYFAEKVADDSDSTYVHDGGNNGGQVVAFGMQNPTLYRDSTIIRMSVCARVRSNSSVQWFFYTSSDTTKTSTYYADGIARNTSGNVWTDLPPFEITTTPWAASEPFSWETFDRMNVAIHAGGGTSRQISKVWIVLHTADNHSVIFSGDVKISSNTYIYGSEVVSGSVTASSGFYGNLAGNASTSSTSTYSENSNKLDGQLANYYASAASLLEVRRSTPTFTGTPDGTKFLRDDYSWQAVGGGDGVVISTYSPNIIHIGGDVFVASTTFNPIYGGLYRVQNSTWEITGISFYNFGTSSVGSTYYNLAYSSSTGATVTWEYILGTHAEVPANTKSSGIIEVHKNIPPGSWLALHVTGIPASGTLPNEFGVVLRYKKVD
jgi:hypothetical protein